VWLYKHARESSKPELARKIAAKEPEHGTFGAARFRDPAGRPAEHVE